MEAGAKDPLSRNCMEIEQSMGVALLPPEANVTASPATTLPSFLDGKRFHELHLYASLCHLKFAIL